MRRVWPDRLDVTLEEHVPLARWGKDALVNTHGERFAGRSDAHAAACWTAPTARRPRWRQRLLRFSEILAPLGLDDDTASC